jgi:hypothetical protein
VYTNKEELIATAEPDAIEAPLAKDSGIESYQYQCRDVCPTTLYRVGYYIMPIVNIIAPKIKNTSRWD